MKDYNKVDINELEQDMIIFFHAKDFDLVKYLLTSPKLIRHADINTRHDYLFDHACMTDNLEFIKFILETPNLQRTVPLAASCIKGIQHSAKRNHLEVLKYFEDNLKKAQGFISTPFYQTLMQDACASGSLDTFKYLTQKYCKLTDLNEKDYEKFSKQFQGNHISLIHYLIFDLNIPKTKYVEEFIEKSKIKDEINNLFQLRELNKNLNSELPSLPTLNKKSKI